MREGQPRAAIVLAALALFGTACVPEGDGPPAGATREPIVNGTDETGYPGVGALVVDYGTSWGHFCTGTLIAPRWVLTAAHCLTGADTPEPYMTSFYVGPNALSEAGGTAYEIEAFYPHSGYDPSSGTADIGLVCLRAPLTTVSTYTYNTTSLGSSYVGASIHWIGYGLSDGSPETGGGIKRSGSGRVGEIRSTRINYNYGPSIPCRGDSGGPNFLTIGGSERIAGVISAGDTRCESWGYDTRVDAYASWIASTMAAGCSWVNCNPLGGSCGGEACWAVDTMVWDCVTSGGRGRGASCNPDSSTWGDTVPCADGFVCMETASGATTGTCVDFCRTDADCTGDARCRVPIFTTDATVGACLATCDLLGGDCGAGSACAPATTGAYTECRASGGRGDGADCDPSFGPSDPVPCADGLACVRTGGLHYGTCSSFCRSDADCTALEMCDIPFDRDIPDVGACVCRDIDRDGWCLPDDCDDGAVGVNPGAAEACGDSVDNNCDGVTDEGCGCADVDGDTYCPPTDCNDGDGAIHPGAAETCDNGVDEDCDGETDEGCTCVDDDGDTWCSDVDCNDGDTAVNPAQPDVCGDGVDNDCDGDTDETCSCIDDDGDTWCSDVDCNDSDPGIYPGGSEACGYGGDFDCDGLYDLDDPDCWSSGGGDGCSCAAAGARGSGAVPLLALLGALALLRRRRR